MSNDARPRLCGGTFFNIVLGALKPKATASEHYDGVNDGLDDQSVLIALVNIFVKGYVSTKSASFKTQTSEYKNFRKASGTNLPFDDATLVDNFNEKVCGNYQEALSDMAIFATEFLKEEKWTRLVKALLELIEGDCGDDGIDDAQPFYCLESGNKIVKSELLKLTEVCLPAFLLGVWHFIILNRSDNNPGNAKIEFKSIGSSIKRKITVSMPEIKMASEDAVQECEPTVEYEEPHEKQATDTYENESSRTYINQAPIFQQFGANGKQINISHGATLIINND